MDGGDVVRYATANGINKFEIFNWNTGGSIVAFLATPYTIIGSILGGTFLTMASHGTDQLLVQRLLGCETKRDSQKALYLDATFILLQFAFFLVLGLCLYAFYNAVSLQQLGLKSSDEIFPKFIVESLPVGLSWDSNCGRFSFCNGNAFLLNQLACLFFISGFSSKALNSEKLSQGKKKSFGPEFSL